MERKYYLFFGIVIAVAAIAAILLNTFQNIPGNEPKWVRDLIANELDGPVANPPASLTKCTYRGGTVYYLPSRCCDIPGVLYDEQGGVICAPEGGFTGSGDGRCPDFFDERAGCEIIWKDFRSNP